MSMNYCSEETYGLFLDQSTAIELARKITEKKGYLNGEDYDTCEPFEIGEIIDVVTGFDLVCGLKYPINEKGVDNEAQQIDDYIVIECDKYPMLFEGCYNSIDDMVQEFKEKTYGFLSEEYIRNNLCKVVSVEVR